MKISIVIVLAIVIIFLLTQLVEFFSIFYLSIYFLKSFTGQVFGAYNFSKKNDLNQSGKNIFRAKNVLCEKKLF